MKFEVLTKTDIEFLVESLSNLEALIENLSLPSNNPWLSEPQAMDYLQVSKSTIQRYRKQNLLHFSQYSNKIMYKVDDLNAFLESNYTGTVTPLKAIAI